ncbi:MAG TPA: hypothetical protein VML00_12140, partial [Bacteroidota bacterium]|nr:hypothetical protein [Bacteroidota bacterium]
MRRLLVLCACTCAVSAAVLPAHAGETIGEALRRIAVVVIPPGPLPVERTVARELCVRVEERSGGPPAQGAFSVRVGRNVPDDAPPRFMFRIAADG